MMKQIILVSLTSLLATAAFGSSNNYDTGNSQMVGVPSAWAVTTQLGLPGVFQQYAVPDADGKRTGTAIRWHYDAVLTVSVDTPINFILTSQTGDVTKLREASGPYFREIEYKTTEDSGLVLHSLLVAWRDTQGTTVLGFECEVSECVKYGDMKARLVAMNKGNRIRDPGQSPPRSTTPNRVRATEVVEGLRYEFTDAMLDDARALGEILAGAPMTKDESLRIDEEDFRHFRADPPGFLDNMANIAKGLEQYAASDLVGRAKWRQSMLSALFTYNELNGGNEEILAYVSRHNPILQWDEAQRQVITRRAVQSLATSNRYAALIVGRAVNDNHTAAGIEDYVADYENVNDGDRNMLFRGEAQWAAMVSSWLSLTDVNIIEGEFRHAVELAEQGFEVPAIARALEIRAGAEAGGSTNGGSSAAAQRSINRFRDQMFEQMQITGVHAARMIGIISISDSIGK